MTRSDAVTPPFAGLSPSALGFFAELAANQNREWFLANKQRYEATLREPMQSLVGSLSLALEIHDIPLRGDPKTALFRVNRDVRFSKEKIPYKTNISAVLSRDGSKRSQGVLYVHAALTGCFAAIGFYMLDPDQLRAMRAAIVANPARWRKAVGGLDLSREQIAVRLPSGIEAPPELHEALRLKSFITRLALDAADFASPDLIGRIVDFTEAGRDMLEFGWNALASLPPRREAKR